MSRRTVTSRCRLGSLVPLGASLALLIPVEARAQQRCWVRGEPYTVDVIAQRDEFFRQMTFDKYILQSAADGWTWTSREGASMMPQHLLPPGSFNTMPPTRLEVQSGLRDGRGRATWTQGLEAQGATRIDFDWTAPPLQVCEGDLFDFEVEATVMSGDPTQEEKIYYTFARAMSQPRQDEDFTACQMILLSGDSSQGAYVGGGGSGPGVGGGYGTHVKGSCRRYMGPLAQLDEWWIRLDLPAAFSIFYPYSWPGPEAGQARQGPAPSDPLTMQEIDTILRVQERAGGIWRAAESAHGDTRAARLQTIEAIRELPGVVASGLSDDGLSIWIDYASGVEGGLMLNPPQDPSGPIAAAEQASGLTARLLDVLGSILKPASTLAQTSTHVLENRKVLFWNPLALDYPNLESIQDYDMPSIFGRAEGEGFVVDVLVGEKADLESVGRFADYGTVILMSHGAVHNGKVAFMTGEKATLWSRLWRTHSEDLRAKRLVVYNGFRTEAHGQFVVYPDFVKKQQKRRFPGSIIFAGGCQSLVKDSMARVFLEQGASIYFGWSGLTCPPFEYQALHGLFGDMMTDRVDALEAHGRLPKEFTSFACVHDDNPLREKLLYQGTNVSYFPELVGGFAPDDYRAVYPGFDGVANDVEGRGFMAWTAEGELPTAGVNVYCFDPASENHLIERFRSDLMSGRHGPLTGNMEALFEDERSAQAFVLHRGLCRIEAMVNGGDSAGSTLRSILARAKSKIDERFPAARQ